MKRLLLILATLMFGVTHAAAAPSALCWHVSLEAHKQALESADVDTAAEAHHEEASAGAKKMASDNVSASVGIGVLPDLRYSFELPDRTHLPWVIDPPSALRSRAIAPLLHPPLA